MSLYSTTASYSDGSYNQRRHYPPHSQQDSSQMRHVLRNDPFPALFEDECDIIKNSATTPHWIKSMLSIPHRQKIIQGLGTKINQCRTDNRVYMNNIDALDRSYQCFSEYLQSADIRQNNMPVPDSFQRSSLLIHFVRTLIPEVAHPMIMLRSAQTYDSTFNHEIQSLYDALTILVMMNTLIDDSADCLVDRHLVQMMSKIHRTDQCETILQDIPVEWSHSKKIAYESFVSTAILLWKQAISIIGKTSMTESVLNGFDLVIQCMEASIDLAESNQESSLKGYDWALRVFSPGMMTHIFFEIELVKLKELNCGLSDIEENTELQKLFTIINSATLNLARLSNDIVTFERELMSGGFTNTLFHLCQDNINQNPNDHTDLSVLLRICCKSSDPKAKNRAKNEILDCIKRYNINELIHDKWLEQFHYLVGCKQKFHECLPSDQAVALSNAVDRLCKGHENLLVMYIVMSKFKGAT